MVASAMMKLDSYNGIVATSPPRTLPLHPFQTQTTNVPYIDMWVGGNTVNNTFRYIAIIGAVIILIGIITATLLYMIRSRKVCCIQRLDH